MLDCLNSGVESTQDLDFNHIFWLLLAVNVEGREKPEQPSQLWGVRWTLVLGLSNSVLTTFDVFLLFLRRHTVQSLKLSTAVLLSTMSQRKTQCGSKRSLLTLLSVARTTPWSADTMEGNSRGKFWSRQSFQLHTANNLPEVIFEFREMLKIKSNYK